LYTLYYASYLLAHAIGMRLMRFLFAPRVYRARASFFAQIKLYIQNNVARVNKQNMMISQ